MKIIAIIGTLAVGAGLVSAQTTNTYSVNPNAAIPVGNNIGLTSTLDVTGLAGQSISAITISLDIVGGYNGSLYAYLAGPNGGGFDVLLNQPGSSGGSIGYTDSGLNITLDDSAANNIQNYETTTGALPANTQLTGVWQSAGTDLASFGGTDPDGTWTLFVANTTGGSPQSTLSGWGFTVVTSPVPEPQTWPLMAMGLFGLATVWKYRRLMD